jgi:hypothetical protein
MTRDELKEMFSKRASEFLRFGHIDKKDRLSERPDLNAMMLLAMLVHEDGPIISCSLNGEIFFAITLDSLAAVATPAQVLMLIRSGVRITSRGLSMVV